MLIIPILVCLILVALTFFGPARPPATRGISTLEQVKIGGMQHWVSIRGERSDLPVLLFLHGGPGSANLAKLRKQVPELEKYFIVVSWDQLGAGKSSTLGFDYSTLSISQMVSDAHELTQWVMTQFSADKIYLMGFSWGTIIGLSLVNQYPEDYKAYIGVSQIINPSKGEQYSLDFVQQKCQTTSEPKICHDLSLIDPSYSSADWFSQLMVERKWLLEYGGVFHNASSYSHEAIMLLTAREYSLMDFIFWPMRSTKSLRSLWPEIMELDFSKTINNLNVPVYFFLGRFDQNTPGQLCASYFENLDDPSGKHLVWFENSAHDLFFDEPDQLLDEIQKILEEHK